MSKRNLVFLCLLFVSVISVSQETGKFVNYKWDLFRAVQGTIQVAREQSIGKKYTFCSGVMGTYASTRGLAKPYLQSQKFTYLDPSTNISFNLNNVQVIGWGTNFQIRKYLGENPKVGNGFYGALELFYRKLFLESDITLIAPEYINTVKRTLNLGYVGYSLGYQKVYNEILSIDSYLGGGFFMSKYNDQNHFTEYRNVYQVDYTGFYLNMGVLIGIVR